MRAAWPVLLLVLAVVGLLVPRLRPVSWAAPAAFAAVAVASGVVSSQAAATSIHPLLAPLAFVVLAVPMAVMLDRYGLFSELASLVTGGRTYLGALWILAALVTATLNLDVAVVLLTPLYVRVAERRGVSRFAVALQPALLSALASSALPVSNLTNLIATAHDQLSVAALLRHLGPSTVVATVVGWLCYRRGFSRIEAVGSDAESTAVGSDAESTAVGSDAESTAEAEETPSLPRGVLPAAPSRPRSHTLAVGGALVVAVVAGFLVAPNFGGQPYEVVAVADILLATMTRQLPIRDLPWRSVGIVIGLGVLASAAASHLDIARVLGGASPADIVRTTALAATSANVVNNLPALLVALPAIGRHASWSLWAVLLGTNAGPLVLPSGSLAVLLWLSTVRRLGVPVRDRDFVRVGWWIGLPALVAATGTLVLVRLLLGSSH